jgi:ATP-dependent RNA helicase RhlE
MTFDDLNLTTPLRNALQDMGYIHPTTIQAKGFSVIMSGRDVLGIAQTGTGKTVAYLLPSIRQMEFGREKKSPKILIIVPTRELVLQVVTVAEKLTTYLDVAVRGVYGGVNVKTHVAVVENGVDILVATPGRLLELAMNGTLKLKAIKKLIIDEVDEMLNLGFRTPLSTLFDLLPPKRQNLLFSATITKEVEELTNIFFKNPERIEAAPNGSPLANIQQNGYLVPNFNTKINFLHLLLSDEEAFRKVLVFAATKKLADELYEQLKDKFKDAIGVIHSNKDQNNRFNTVKLFHDGTIRILIATDIIARGLDIAEVNYVINFDTPEVPENYIHRIGRTGRADKKGNAITFISPLEREQQAAIEALMNFAIPLAPLPDDLVISTVLRPDEIPKVQMKNVQVKILKREASGPSFHEKLDKNKKVNIRVSRQEKNAIKRKARKARK